MKKNLIMFGDIETKKCKFHSPKNSIFLKNLDIG